MSNNLKIHILLNKNGICVIDLSMKTINFILLLLVLLLLLLFIYFFFERDSAMRKCSMSVTDLLTKLLYSCRIKIYAIVDT